MRYPVLQAQLKIPASTLVQTKLQIVTTANRGKMSKSDIVEWVTAAMQPTAALNMPRRERVGRRRHLSDSDEDMAPLSGNPSMWAMYGDTFSACEKAVSSLPAGEYLIRANPERGPYLAKKETDLDELLILPDTESEKVVAGIKDFWTRETKYREFGFLWKRGILLWGPPGGGKTSTVQLIVNEIIRLNGITVYVQAPDLAIMGLELIRKVEKTRPLLVILEDIDAIINNHGEAELLSLLDGEFQFDNVVFLATTNYPERLDKRISNRPSRFDVICHIKMPSPDARRFYLKAKNSRLALAENTKELDEWVNDTHMFSIAHLKELIISVECLGLGYDTAMDRLKEMVNVELSSTSSGRQAGFI